MTKKEYIIKATINGFIIRRAHVKDSYDETNMQIASTLKEVADLIEADLKELIEKIKDKLV